MKKNCASGWLFTKSWIFLL